MDNHDPATEIFEAAVPSKAEANKVLRVLEGKPLKFTCQVHFPNGEVTEFQSDHRPEVKWHDDTRMLWLWVRTSAEDYDPRQVMEWSSGCVIMCEQNPEWQPIKK